MYCSQRIDEYASDKMPRSKKGRSYKEKKRELMLGRKKLHEKWKKQIEDEKVNADSREDASTETIYELLIMTKLYGLFPPRTFVFKTQEDADKAVEYLKENPEFSRTMFAITLWTLPQSVFTFDKWVNSEEVKKYLDNAKKE